MKGIKCTLDISPWIASFTFHMPLKTFYNGLTNETKTLVDVIAGRSLMGKNIEDVYELLEKIAANAYQWPTEHNAPKKTLGVQAQCSQNFIFPCCILV